MDRISAAESIKRHNQYGEQGDKFFAEWICGQREGAALALRIAQEAGCEKEASIAQTVLDTLKGGNRYRRVTTKQVWALSQLLLGALGTKEVIGAAIWGLTPEEIEAAEI